MKFVGRSKKKAIKMAGDQSLEEIEAHLQQRDGAPTVIGAVQAVHLKPHEGIRCGGIVGQSGEHDKVTIEYFGMGYGRSSPVRLLCEHWGIPFEYKGYDFPEWGAIKGAGQGGEFGGLPRVCINGEEFGQSMATLRMMGTKKGLYDPKDWKSAAYIDPILDAWVDLLN